MLRRALVVTGALVVGSVSGASAIEPASPTPALVTAARGSHAANRPGAGATAPTAEAARLPTATSALSADPRDWSDAELLGRLETDLGSVGSLSLGRPNAGALVNGVQMPTGEGWEVVDPGRSWATTETVGYLLQTFAKLRQQFPDAPRVFVGHLSREKGGPLGPHRSHQSGRDVDLGYIHLGKAHGWYQRASARNLDVARTWALIRALVTETDVEMMFVDLGVQKLLKEHALSIGEDPGWLDSLFRYKSHHPEPLIRQAWGHATHVHVRFYNPRAQALGLRSYAALGELGVIAPRTRVVRYQARPGDTAVEVARRAGTTAATIQKFNRGNVESLVAGQIYLVPVRGQVAEVTSLELPPRRLPPTVRSSSALAAGALGAAIASSGRASPRP